MLYKNFTLTPLLVCENHGSLRWQILYLPVAKLKKCSSQAKIFGICGTYHNFWWNLTQNLPYNTERTTAEFKTKGRGQPWLDKNTVRRYYGLFITSFWPKTSNCFIRLAFFEKITPVLVNKKSDDANITD